MVIKIKEKRKGYKIVKCDKRKENQETGVNKRRKQR